MERAGLGMIRPQRLVVSLKERRDARFSHCKNTLEINPWTLLGRMHCCMGQSWGSTLTAKPIRQCSSSTTVDLGCSITLHGPCAASDH